MKISPINSPTIPYEEYLGRPAWADCIIPMSLLAKLHERYHQDGMVWVFNDDAGTSMHYFHGTVEDYLKVHGEYPKGLNIQHGRAPKKTLISCDSSIYERFTDPRYFIGQKMLDSDFLGVVPLTHRGEDAAKTLGLESLLFGLSRFQSEVGREYGAVMYGKVEK